MGNTATSVSMKPVGLPAEPRFWKRYSPHHEFSLSISSSVFLHILCVGLLCLILVGILKLRPQESPLPVGVIGGGSGEPQGVNNGLDNGPIQPGMDETDLGQSHDPRTNPTEPPLLVKPQVCAPNLIKPPAERRINDEDATIGNQKLAEIRASLKPSGKGMNGGESGGDVGGRGPGKGPGTGGLDVRAQCRNRWIMIFNTHSGQDYANQLAGLGEIIGVKDSDGKFTLYRDLHHRPVKGKVEDPNQPSRIFWEDNKRDSVTSLANALGIKPVPDSIFAFFPEELEKQLLDLELAAFRGKEDEIAETHFRVEKAAPAENTCRWSATNSESKVRLSGKITAAVLLFGLRPKFDRTVEEYRRAMPDVPDPNRTAK